MDVGDGNGLFDVVLEESKILPNAMCVLATAGAGASIWGTYYGMARAIGMAKRKYENMAWDTWNNTKVLGMILICNERFGHFE